MPILDSIKVSEQKAEFFRLEASLQVEKLLLETQAKSESLAKEMISAALLDEVAKSKSMEAAIEQKRNQVFDQANLQDELVSKKAKGRLKEVVDFLLKKVIES